MQPSKRALGILLSGTSLESVTLSHKGSVALAGPWVVSCLPPEDIIYNTPLSNGRSLSFSFLQDSSLTTG